MHLRRITLGRTNSVITGALSQSLDEDAARKGVTMSQISLSRTRIFMHRLGSVAPQQERYRRENTVRSTRLLLHEFHEADNTE